MHNCVFMSDQLQIEPDMTKRTTGPSIKTARPTSYQPRLRVLLRAFGAAVTHRITPHKKPPQGLAQWFNVYELSVPLSPYVTVTRSRFAWSTGVRIDLGCLAQPALSERR